MKTLAVGLIALVPLGGRVEAAPPTPPTFPSDANVVLLDVVARDRKGRQIDDLRTSEFQVTENGRVCAIRSVRLVQANASAVPEMPPRAAASSVSPSVRPPAAPARPRVVALVFDRLKIAEGPLAWKGAVELLSRLSGPDTSFAVFQIGHRLRELQPFTNDEKRLRSAVLQATGADQASGRVRGAEAGGHASASVERENAEMTRIGGLDSLFALQGVVRSLGSIEGRKAIVYFSGAWHLGTSVLGPYEEVVSEANRANIAIHTVDARGLTAEEPFVATLGPLGARARAPMAHLNAGSDPPRPMTQSFETLEDRLRGPNTERLADDTGGLVIRDTNDLGAGLTAVAEELSQYYEIVYVPANPDLDGRFRHIAVKVSRPGVRLRTRAGYLATPRR
jgi:VWFA-related protein